VSVAQATPDLASAEFKANPHPFYTYLRAEAPVFPTTVRRLGRERAFLVSRYADAVAVLRDPRFGKQKPSAGGRGVDPWTPGFLKPLQRNMLDVDAPDHTRLRSLVHKGFTPRLIEQLRGRIQALCDQFLDAAQARGRIELVSGYALPLPATIIADLLGVPSADRNAFHRWSSHIVSIASPRDFLVAMPFALMFLRYLRRLIAARRAEPRDDLISALVQVEEAGDRLSTDELLAMVFLLLVAGHETTVTLIGSGTLALLQPRDQFERLRSEPALVGSAVEELLRFTSPVEIATERYAREPVDIAGTLIPTGHLVLVGIGAANRDQTQFADPDVLDLARDPNPHLAFGQGIHYCLGAPLARLEAQIAFLTLIDRFPNLRLAVDPTALRWRRGLFLRGVRQLPLLI
jgi:cytochrome P450